MLAGELRTCGGDYGAAFARYQERLMPFLKRKQAVGGEVRFRRSPRRPAFGIAFRNLVTRLLRLPFVADFLVGRELRDDIKLPDYGF